MALPALEAESALEAVGQAAEEGEAEGVGVAAGEREPILVLERLRRECVAGPEGVPVGVPAAMGEVGGEGEKVAVALALRERVPHPEMEGVGEAGPVLVMEGARPESVAAGVAAAVEGAGPEPEGELEGGAGAD